MNVSSEKETSEENDEEPNIEEKENENQDLICFASEKVYGTIWEVQVQEEKMETKQAWSKWSMKIISTFYCEEEYSRNL